MNDKKEKTVAYCLMIGLFVVGLITYAAFPVPTPEDPIRIMLKNAAGKVLFDHKEHSSEEGYGIECLDCHHLWEEDSGEKPVACGGGECHEVEVEEPVEPDDPINRFDAFHDQCIGCHEDDGTAPIECEACHVL